MPGHQNQKESEIFNGCLVEFDFKKPELSLVCINSQCKRCIKPGIKQSQKLKLTKQIDDFEHEIIYLQEEIMIKQDELEQQIKKNDDKINIKKIQYSIKYLREEVQYYYSQKIKYEKECEIIK